MRILTFHREVEAAPSSPALGLRIWTWTVEIYWFGIGAFNRYRLVDDPPGEEGRIVDEYSASLSRHWAFGPYHAWYDGPWCCFSLGFLHLNWRNWSCKRCLGPSERKD